MNKEIIKTRNLSVGYGSNVLLKDANFEVHQGEIFIIMGGSGSGKSSLLKVLTGLIEPLSGSFDLLGVNFNLAGQQKQLELKKKTGILYQSGALFSSMTLEENVAMPLHLYSKYSASTIEDLARFKLALVGLSGYEDYYPSEISGGMKKRAGLARALALDPEIVYFDEPSAGLDPVSSERLDELMCEINQNLKTTLVVVTHELQSIFNIAQRCIYVDAATKTISAQGSPSELIKNPPNDRVYQFLTRGKTK